MNPIGSILWPANQCEAVNLLRRYMLEVVENLDVHYDSAFSPIKFLKDTTNEMCHDNIHYSEYRKLALNYWWKIVEEKDVRNFEPESVMARFAICMINPTCDSVDFGLHIE